MTDILRPTHLIGRHLRVPEGSPPAGPCCMCGDADAPQLDRAKAISSTFPDGDRLGSEARVCVYCAACLGYGIEARTEWLRNHSFVATEGELVRLKREEIWARLMSPPKEPYVFGVTYAHKKHVSFKAPVNLPGQRPFVVRTENGECRMDPDGRDAGLIAAIRRWYTVCRDTAQQPTWFTKAEILAGCSNFRRIEDYGVERWRSDDEVIAPRRRTPELELYVHVLNKEISE